MDADRIAALHVPVVQLNTDSGFGGECHLDANMVRSALGDLPLAELDLLVIENVGNLVCPAEFRVGEDARMMVSSVTEGEDKPLKYPLMFRACELVVVNKIDLLPHLDFDLDRFLANLDAVNPGVERMLVSARTGEGIDEFARLAGRRPRRARPPAGRGRRGDARRPRRRGRRGSLERRRPRDGRTRVLRAPRPSGSPGSATRMAERFARGGRLVALGSRPPRARTSATSRSSSSTR